MTTAKQRAWRAKFAQLYGRKKSSVGRRKVRRTVNMARRYGRRRNGGGGLGTNKLLKAALFGIGASMLLPRFVGIDSKLAGALGGFYGGGPIGAAVGYFVPGLIGGSVSAGSTNSAW